MFAEKVVKNTIDYNSTCETEYLLQSMRCTILRQKDLELRGGKRVVADFYALKTAQGPGFRLPKILKKLLKNAEKVPKSNKKVIKKFQKAM
jgi:hypothetical protein